MYLMQIISVSLSEIVFHILEIEFHHDHVKKITLPLIYSSTKWKGRRPLPNDVHRLFTDSSSHMLRSRATKLFRLV